MWKAAVSLERVEDMAEILGTQHKDVCIGSLWQILSEASSWNEAAVVERFERFGRDRVHRAGFETTEMDKMKYPNPK